MSSLPTLAATFDFGDDPAPQDKIDATEVDIQLGLVIAYANEIKARLDLLTRSDDTLQDGLVRLRNLHAEIVAVFGSKIGWQPIAACACATTGNITLSGEQTIDGVLTSASRVLVKDQTLPAQNGIYVSGAGAWTRATDADSGDELGYAFVSVLAGTANIGSGWVVTAAAAAIEVGTTGIVWARFFGEGTGGVGAEAATRSAADIAEAAARAAAVTAEATARAAADATNATAIAAEATTRAANDTAEATARAAADTAEASARAAAIAAEATARGAAIAAEATARDAAIAVETARAEAAEAAILSAIPAVIAPHFFNGRNSFVDGVNAGVTLQTRFTPPDGPSDAEGNWNFSGKYYLVPEDGWYEIACGIKTDETDGNTFTVGETMDLSIGIGASNFGMLARYVCEETAVKSVWMAGVKTIHCALGDQLNIKWHNGSATAHQLEGTSQNFLNIRRVY